MGTTNPPDKSNAAKNLALTSTASLLLLLFHPSLHAAQASAEMTVSPLPNIEKQSKTFAFEIAGKDKGHPGAGTLKFIEAKNFVQLEFESSGLKGGNYKIIRGENCKTVERKLHSNRPLSEAEEIYSFQTQYGDISTEKKLNVHKLEELNLDNQAVALVKVEKKKNILVACTQ